MTKEEILKQYYSISLPEEGGIFEAMEEYAKEQCSNLAAEYLNDSRNEKKEMDNVFKSVANAIGRDLFNKYTLSAEDWIKMPETVPSFQKSVLIYNEDMGINIGYRLSEYPMAKMSNTDTYINYEFQTIDGYTVLATHWMELPEEPKIVIL